MTEFLKQLFYKNSLTDWGISILIVISAFLAGRIIFWLFKNVITKFTLKTKSKLDDTVVDMLEEPAVFLVIIAGFYYSLLRLDFPASLDQWISKIFFGLVTLTVTWFISRTISKLIDFYLVPLTKKSKNSLDDQLLPILKKSISWGIWTLGFIVALNNAGFDVGALIAGMGIGGLAFAMAAKDTLSNFFGGVTVFIDRPFKVGDRIKIGGFDGSVLEVGLRSTRLKTLEGRIVTIPNSKFTDGMVENVSLEPNRKVKLVLGLTYDTSAERMRQAMDILKNIMGKDHDTEEEYYLGFDSFGDFSLGITLIYYIKSGKSIMETKSKINLEILEKFNEEGLIFAFPTTTLDLTNMAEKPQGLTVGNQSAVQGQLN